MYVVTRGRFQNILSVKSKTECEYCRKLAPIWCVKKIKSFQPSINFLRSNRRAHPKNTCCFAYGGNRIHSKFITYVHGSRLVFSDLFYVSASVSSKCAMTNVYLSASFPHQLYAKTVKIRKKCHSTFLVVNACSVSIGLLNAGGFYPLNLCLFTRIRSRIKILI